MGLKGGYNQSGAGAQEDKGKPKKKRGSGQNTKGRRRHLLEEALELGDGLLAAGGAPFARNAAAAGGKGGVSAAAGAVAGFAGAGAAYRMQAGKGAV